MDDRNTVLCIMALGRAQELLGRLLDNDLFESLSKHDLDWQSEHERESDRLDTVRMQLGCIRDQLWDLNTILHPIEEC